ncbi:hypothetical protein BMS3Abin10_00290 [bacterium BMS3Abin10]|nr:hypothetical protein BMS3Abin10_00290 [bacterium BMS3Abin10]GBE37559.1 hypothetical protein BMS3Bbin08_00149 [bacterium BMS3Bbin08]
MLIVLSFPFTHLGWMIFSLNFFKDKTLSPIDDFLMYFFMWPSLLLDSIGIMITNHSLGLIPNAIGWGLVGLGISSIRTVVRKYHLKKLKI